MFDAKLLILLEVNFAVAHLAPYVVPEKFSVQHILVQRQNVLFNFCIVVYYLDFIRLFIYFIF